MAGAARRPCRGHQVPTGPRECPRHRRRPSRAARAVSGRADSNRRRIRGGDSRNPRHRRCLRPDRLLPDLDLATHPRNLDHRYNLELFLGGSPETARAAYQSAGGAMLVTPRAPPTLILHGGLDINVFPEQAQMLDAKLAAAGVPHALVSLPWAGHAFDFVNFNTPGAQIGRYATARFLASVTR